MTLDLRPPAVEVRAAAAAWQARLTSGTCSAAERRSHAAWLAASEAHRRAFNEVLGAWRALPAAARLRWKGHPGAGR